MRGRPHRVATLCEHIAGRESVDLTPSAVSGQRSLAASAGVAVAVLPRFGPSCAGYTLVGNKVACAGDGLRVAASTGAVSASTWASVARESMALMVR